MVAHSCVHYVQAGESVWRSPRITALLFVEREDVSLVLDGPDCCGVTTLLRIVHRSVVYVRLQEPCMIYSSSHCSLEAILASPYPFDADP